MYAIASLFDPASDLAVRALWQRFESTCGLIGIQTAPLPHFTWTSAEDYQFEPLERSLREMAETQKTFTVRAAGLGIFTGERPVVYISLIKDAFLMNLHQSIIDQVQPCAIKSNEYYHPSRWMPHITLAFRETEPRGLGCAVEEIAFQPIEWEMMVDNFTILSHLDGVPGQKNRFEFKEKLSVGGYE